MKRMLFPIYVVLAVLGCGGDMDELPPCFTCILDICGSQRYDSSKEDCCSNEIYSRETQFCSEGTVYSASVKGNNISNYRTVVIGTQTWMAENLDYAVEGSRCYNNSAANCGKYGRLYDWVTAKTVCPSGWHLPSQAEWNTLSSYVQKDIGCSSCDAKLLKATSGWNSNGNGTDTYGFSALPGGYGYSGGSFITVGYYGYWWSSNEYNASYAYLRYMYYNYEYAYWNDYGKSYLFSVRCVKD